MKFLDLFSGIGGFRVGMEKAGHICLGHVEIDKFANLSYAAMHKPKESEYFGTDIRAIDPWDLPDADIYCCGFPCQSFSIAGKRGGFEDTRGTLFFEIARLVKERKPEMLLLENVRGLLSHDKGNTFETIIGTLGELGYTVEWEVINSKAWVPQNRERVFIVGHLGGSGGREVFPIGESNGGINESEQEGAQAEILPTIDTRTGALSHYAPYIIENKVKIAIPVLTPDRAEKRQNGRRFKEDGGSGHLSKDDGTTYCLDSACGQAVEVSGIYSGVSPAFQRGPLEGLSRTLKAAKHDACVTDGFRIRRLTPKECFRLQGFPDEYFERAASVCSNSQLYKQAGNSVTTKVVYEIAKRIRLCERREETR